MKQIRFLILTVVISIFYLLPNLLAQDDTRSSWPEGAKTRLDTRIIRKASVNSIMLAGFDLAGVSSDNRTRATIKFEDIEVSTVPLSNVNSPGEIGEFSFSSIEKGLGVESQIARYTNNLPNHRLFNQATRRNHQYLPRFQQKSSFENWFDDFIFNGKHKGFIFGGGIGYGVGTTIRSIDRFFETGDFLQIEYSSFSLHPKIGYGFSERSLFYLSSQFPVTGIVTLGGMYFPHRPENGTSQYYSRGIFSNPNFYMHGSLGLTPFTNTIRFGRRVPDFAISGGLGWEFYSYMNFEVLLGFHKFTYNYLSSLETYTVNSLDVEILMFSINFNILFY